MTTHDEVRVTVEKHDDFWHVRAFSQELTVGKAYCQLDGSRLCIQDILVEKDNPTPQSWCRRLAVSVGWIRPPAGFRGRHIGSRMLKRILDEADGAGVTETWGSVTHSDIDATPYLLAWYARHGFALTEPDVDCLQNAAKKIVRKHLAG